MTPAHPTPSRGDRPERRVRAARAPRPALVLAVAGALALAGCATGPAGGAAEDSGAEGAKGGTVVLAVHDSFPNEEFAAAASAATGYEVEVVSAGDGGELTNKLVLTKGAPIADAFFGVDTNFASRLVDNGVVSPYRPTGFPASGEDYAIAGDDGELLLTPVDRGAVCFNIDTEWFAAEGIEEPESYEDLADPAYRDLTALLDPTASSTGASLLVGTVAEFGEDGFAGYWQRLMDNGARIEQGWSDAYYGQFTQGGEGGTRPIVLSYASSPAFTVNEAGTETSTRALLDTCTRQVEFAGVLAGAANEAGARAVLDYLVSREFQQTIPDAMYMTPVDDSVEMPGSWAELAPEPAAGRTHDLDPAEIERGREGWLRTLSEQIGL